MITYKRSCWIVILTAGLFFSNAFLANAQIVYEDKSSSNGFGGMGAFESTAKVFLTDEMRRKETSTTFTGALMKHFNAKGKNVEITRMDREVFWNFETSGKTYTEIPFAKFKEMLEQNPLANMPNMKPTQPEEKGQSEYDWEKPVIKVTEGQKANVNGFNCKNYIVTMTIVGTHRQTSVKDTMIWVSDLWNSVVKATAMAKMEEFDIRLMKKLGLDELANSGIGNIMAAYKDYFKELSEETSKLEGYPIKTSTRMTASDHAKEVRKKEGEEVSQEQNADMTDVRSALGGFFGKKAKSMVQKDKASGSAQKEVFQFAHEIVSIQKQDISADNFEVPAGLKKKDLPEMK